MRIYMNISRTFICILTLPGRAENALGKLRVCAGSPVIAVRLNDEYQISPIIIWLTTVTMNSKILTDIRKGGLWEIV